MNFSASAARNSGTPSTQATNHGTGNPRASTGSLRSRAGNVVRSIRVSDIGDLLKPECRKFPAFDPMERDVMALHEPRPAAHGDRDEFALLRDEFAHPPLRVRIRVMQRLAAVTALHVTLAAAA